MRPASLLAVILATLVCSVAAAQNPSKSSEPLDGTAPLKMEGDLSLALIDGVDRFLLKQWDLAREKRHKEWAALIEKSNHLQKEIPEFAKLRHQLLGILGAQEPRVPIADAQQVHIHFHATCRECDVYAVSWPVVRTVRGEGLLLVPHAAARDEKEKPSDGFRAAINQGRLPTMGNVLIAIPDADQTPEQIIGLVPGVAPQSQYARHIAAGSYVLVPQLIDRTMEKRNNRSLLSTREFLYRPGFELGRHLLGYELQRVRAAIDWIEALTWKGDNKPGVRVAGYGEGGLLALLAGAVDERVELTGVSGYFGTHKEQWNEPLDRNVFTIWNHFGNAELAVLAIGSPPRGRVVIEASRGPNVELTGAGGGAPSNLRSPQLAQVREEYKVLSKYVTNRMIELIEPDQGVEGWWMAIDKHFPADTVLSENHDPKFAAHDPQVILDRIAARKRRLENQIEEDTQKLLVESPYVRAEFMNKLDTSSVAKYEESVKMYRNYFSNKVIGKFDLPLEKANPRTRQVYDEKLWTGYEVVLDVYPDVIAYGLLLVPKNIKEGERRPVVVCQHGLEGRPQSVIGELQKEAYSAFAAKLAERGYVTFAPQNLYLGKDRFRTLQRKSNPIGKTLFSVIVPQHQQIVNWLAEQDFVDKDRIAFYGLSYGGKSAMRIPPLVPEYCAVICSADFNEWVWKNASTRAPYSYVWTNEYEIFEWDLGSTFNYAEMAALICPRPFMVERGHFDGVSSDEAVAYEFAKVRFLYSARLKLPQLVEMEVFDGPHKINGVDTYKFLDRHLKHNPMEK